MSLTRELRDRESPVHEFFRDRFGNTEPLRESWHAGFEGIETLKPPGPVHWSTIGTAIDYRLRYYFGHKLQVAELGMALLAAPEEWGPVPETPPDTGTDWQQLQYDFRLGLSQTLKKHGSIGHRLARSDEAVLCRYCYVLALFEQLYRAGLQVRSPLYQLGPDASLQRVLALADDAAIQDLCQLSWAFYDTQKDLLMSNAITLNPVFQGSFAIGGADADLILDRCLIELKTTVDPKRGLRDLCWQLLGYALLDFDDRFLLDSVAVYFTRQHKLVRWKLTEMMDVLSDGAHTVPGRRTQVSRRAPRRHDGPALGQTKREASGTQEDLGRRSEYQGRRGGRESNQGTRQRLVCQG